MIAAWSLLLGLLVAGGAWLWLNPAPKPVVATATIEPVIVELPPVPAPVAEVPAAEAPKPVESKSVESKQAEPKPPEPRAAEVKPPPPPPLPRPAPPAPQPAAVVAPSGPLSPAPDPGLTETGPQGPLPIVGKDGREPWRVYARPFGDPDMRPRIAIIVGSLGLSESITTSAVQKLPAAVTLAFLPYAKDLQNWISLARAAGHEVMLHLPMEPESYPNSDPGPQARLTSLNPQDNLARLEWLLSRGGGYVGAVNFMGSKFTVADAAMRPVLTELKSRGLLFVDSRSSPKSLGGTMARDLGMPVARSDSFIDSPASRDAVDAKLEELEKLARRDGAALGIGFLYPVTIERIVNWAPGLGARGVVLAPVSAVVNRQPIK